MKIYTVFYKSNKTRKEIGRNRSLKKAERVIYRFLKSKNYKAPYWRYWYDECQGYCYDVGSWSEFFYIKEEVI